MADDTHVYAALRELSAFVRGGPGMTATMMGGIADLSSEATGLQRPSLALALLVIGNAINPTVKPEYVANNCASTAEFASDAVEHDILLRAAAVLRGEPMRPPSVTLPVATHDGEVCPGKGRCHGALKWCLSCGDVGEVCCNEQMCDTHRPPTDADVERSLRNQLGVDGWTSAQLRARIAEAYNDGGERGPSVDQVARVLVNMAENKRAHVSADGLWRWGHAR